MDLPSNLVGGSGKSYLLFWIGHPLSLFERRRNMAIGGTLGTIRLRGFRG